MLSNYSNTVKSIYLRKLSLERGGERERERECEGAAERVRKWEGREKKGKRDWELD